MCDTEDFSIVNNNTSVEKYSNIVTNKCLHKNEQVLVYPNPVNDKLFISITGFNNFTAQLTDAAGKIILQKIFKVQQNETISINTNTLSSGLYFLKIIDNKTGTVVVKKVSK